VYAFFSAPCCDPACDTAPHAGSQWMLHLRDMPRSQAQSDFSVTRAPEVRLPRTAEVVALPQAAELLGASDVATRWMLRLTLVVLAVFALLCAIGPHIPGGE
jgi:hypothetical protein